MSASPSRKEHPNNAAGVPMLVPPALENFQIKYINPLMTPLSRKLPGMSVIRHTGRTSGTAYETPVTAYRKGNVLAIGLIHGKTNWVKNVLAAGEAAGGGLLDGAGVGERALDRRVQQRIVETGPPAGEVRGGQRLRGSRPVFRHA